MAWVKGKAAHSSKNCQETCKLLRRSRRLFGRMQTSALICCQDLHYLSCVLARKAGAAKAPAVQLVCARIKIEANSQADARRALRVEQGEASLSHALPLTHCGAGARSSHELAPEYSTSASRSVARRMGRLRQRIDLPSSRVLLPAGSALRRKADWEH
jgi:hypothetical protein